MQLVIDFISIYMYTTLHVSSVKRSSSGVPHCTYSLQFLCLCPSVALSCKKKVISPSQRPLPDNTQHSQQTNTHSPGGIRTHNLSRRAAADLRLRLHDHWDRQILVYTCMNLYLLLHSNIVGYINHHQ
jgi:hypothetical protein